MRLVFDTNVLVAALVFPDGVAVRALDRVVEEHDKLVLVLSRPIIEETVGILGRKFGRHDEELARVALFLDDIAEIVAPTFTLDVLADEPDNRILECALAGGAAEIVTGDKAMLALGEHREVRLSALADHMNDVIPDTAKR